MIEWIKIFASCFLCALYTSFEFLEYYQRFFFYIYIMDNEFVRGVRFWLNNTSSNSSQFRYIHWRINNHGKGMKPSLLSHLCVHSRRDWDMEGNLLIYFWIELSKTHLYCYGFTSCDVSMTLRSYRNCNRNIGLNLMKTLWG